MQPHLAFGARIVGLSGALLLCGCGAGGPSASTRVTHVMTADSIAAIPRLVAVDDGTPCPSDFDECLPSGNPIAAADSTWLLLSSEVRRKSQLVRVDRRTGARRLIGREGAGPGEYRFVFAAHVGAAGNVTALDVLQRRLIHFDETGAHDRTDLIEIPNGIITAAVGANAVQFLATDFSNRRRDSAAVVRIAVSPDSGRAPEARMLPVRERAWAMGDLRPLPALFAPATQWTIDEWGNVAHSDGEVPTFAVFGVTGSEYAVELRLPRRRVTAADLEAAHARRIRGISDHRMRSAIFANRNDATAVHPTATRLVLFGDELWVRGSPDLMRDSVRWMVLRPEAGVASGFVDLGSDDHVLLRAGPRVLLMTRGSGAGEFRWVKLDTVR